MGWVTVSFELDAVHAEVASDALLESGAASVDIVDAEAGSSQERPRFDETFDAGNWRRTRVTAVLDERLDAAALVRSACIRAGIEPPRHEVQALAERDWVGASRDAFSPIRISPRIWVVPSWREPPDPAAINLSIDPGLAFGTGSHPTTRLCLRWLEREIRGGESVIDYGCGSGILAIAAMKLGAARATGVDIDEQAVLAARANALHNRVEVSFHGTADDVRGPAQIVIANILARPLIVLAPLLARLTVGGGRLALAGLLTGQAAEVRAEYEAWFEFDAPAHEEEWSLLTATRLP